ncbi:MAG: hypothetical protein MRY72_13100 [Aquisalinus sp.]|nr:hypothetical protein [Aquisalinus sp.]
MTRPVKKPPITWYAMRRYVERVRHYDLNPYKGALKIARDQINDRNILELMQTMGEIDIRQLMDEIQAVPGLAELIKLGAGRIVYDGLRYVVVNHRLVTIKYQCRPEDYRAKPVKRSIRQHRAAQRRQETEGYRHG